MNRFTSEQLQQIRTDFDLIEVGAITINTYQDNIERIYSINNSRGEQTQIRKVVIEKDVCWADKNIRWCIHYKGHPMIENRCVLEWWVPTKEQAIELCSLFDMEIDYIVDEEVPTIKSILSSGTNTFDFDSLINLNLKKLDSVTANRLILDLKTILDSIQ